MDSQNSPEPQGHGRWDTVSLPLLRKRGLQMQIQRATQSDVVGVVPSTIHDPATPSSVSHSRISFEQFRYPGSKVNNVQNGSADSGDRRASSAASSSYFSANSRRQHEVQSSRMEAPRFSEVTSEGRGLAHVVIALAEGRGNAHGEVGLSVIDLRTSVVSLGQYADSASYMKTICKLNALEPSVLIIPETMTAPQNLQPLYTILREFHYQGGPSIVTVQRRLYSEAAGMDLVKKLNLSFDGKLEMELTSKYYCLASLAALITYVESERKLILMPQTLRIEYMQMEDTCLIDVSTSKSLELISNATHQQLANKCLLGVLDHTKTYAGGRLLRANLLQPFTKLLTIQMRLECIQEMVRTEDLYFGLQQLLSRFTGVEKAIAFLVQTPTKESAKVSESYIGSIIHLKHILSLVEPLRDLLTGSHSELLRGFQQMLNDGRFDDMRNIIEILVHPEAKFEKGSLRMKTQKCYAVRPKINGCLDVARLLYAESVDDISALVVKLQEQHNLPLQTGYDVTRGFHLQLFTGGKSPIDVKTLPKDFIHITKTKNTIYCTTKELVNLNGRSLECIREVFVLSHEMLKRACDSLRPLIGCLYELAECVATVDVLVSLTTACSLGDYTRPTFHEVLVLERSRHPILERLLPEPPIPNNAYADEGCNFTVITGPNMAGKTTYMKQIALLQIMAQIGSFVPAEFACFQVYDKILSRFGSGDDIQSNASTFMMEMRDMQYISQHADRGTLVLIDELGRGTSPEEGLGICWALCEELLLTKATTFFVTHFEEICDLQHLYMGIHNVHFRTITKKSDENVVEVLQHTHELVDGSSLDVRYGLATAQSTSLPKEIIADAAHILTKIRAMRFTMGEDEQEFQRQQINCRYASRIVQLGYNKNLSYNDIEDMLVRIRADFLEEMVTLQPEKRPSQGEGGQENAEKIPETPESLSQSLATQMIISQDKPPKKQSEKTGVKRALSEHLLEEGHLARHSKRAYPEIPKSII